MKSALDSLIEELQAGTWQPPPPQAEHPDAHAFGALGERHGPGWSPASADAERRFCQPHARLFPLLGRKVRTPGGPGTLLQVFANRVTVLLDSELSKCVFFRPAEIEPVSKDG